MIRATSIGALAISALVGCRVNPTSPDMANTPAGQPCPPAALIEDAEDADNQVIVQEGRAGYVYTYVDAVGSTVDPPGGAPFTMSPGGANGSKYALRMTGKIGTGNVVYAAMGMNLMDPKGLYDASKYKGVSFYAKRGPGSTGKVRIKFPDLYTDPDGGECASCSNDFGLSLSLSEQWQKFIVPFSALRQEADWGSPRPMSVKKSAIFAIQFQVSDKGRDFDIWVDDVAFTGCE